MSLNEVKTAIRMRNIEKIKEYLNNNFDPNQKFLNKPIIYDIIDHCEILDIIKLFVSKGVDLSIKYENKNMIDYLLNSSSLGLVHLEINVLEYITTYFKDHNYDFYFTYQHLFNIIRDNREDIFKLLIEYKEFNNIVKKYKYEIFMFSLKKGKNSIFFDVSYSNDYLNIRNYDNETLLHICLNNGNISYFIFFFENGIDINDNNNTLSMSPLMICCLNNNIECFDILINNLSINLDLTCKRGYNALMYACANNNIYMIEKLIDKGCDIYHINHQGNNVLFIACIWGFIDIAKLFIKKGIDILYVNKKNEMNLKRCIDYLVNENDKFDLIKMSDISLDLYLTYYLLDF